VPPASPAFILPVNRPHHRVVHQSAPCRSQVRSKISQHRRLLQALSTRMKGIRISIALGFERLCFQRELAARMTNRSDGFGKCRILGTWQYCRRQCCNYRPLHVFAGDGLRSYPAAIREPQSEGQLRRNRRQRTQRYRNNQIESDHRHIKRRLRAMQGTTVDSYGVAGDSGDRGGTDDSQRPGLGNYPAQLHGQTWVFGTLLDVGSLHSDTSVAGYGSIADVATLPFERIVRVDRHGILPQDIGSEVRNGTARRACSSDTSRR
jgi:hypothetical protein